MTHSHPDAGGKDARRKELPIENEREDRALDRGAALYREKWDEWPGAVVSTVAAEIHRRRNELGLSQHELAEQCAELGYDIPRNVLANLESGRRQSLQVVELLVLAKALGAAPVALLFPVGHRDWVHPLPGPATTALSAADWFSGTEIGNEDIDLSLYRRYEQAHQRLAELDGSRRELEESRQSPERPEDLEAIKRQSAEIDEARQRVMTEMGFITESIREDGLLSPTPLNTRPFNQASAHPSHPEENA